MRKRIQIGFFAFRLFVFGIASLLASLDIAAAQPVSGADRTALAGSWQGSWTGGAFRYEAVMSINVDANGDVEGSINWTLRASPRPNEAGKIGMKGTEYVRGKYYPDASALVLEGHRKDDPNAILGLDKYRLVVSPERKSMGGISWHHGPWNGQFFLARR